MKIRKPIRKWVKDEKRIIKLAYRKGLLNHLDVDRLYWDGFKPTPRKYKSDESFMTHWRPYYPEIFIIEVDYWGEADDVGIVDWLYDWVYWKGVDGYEFDPNGYPPSTNQKYMNRPGLIKYLESLPTVVQDSKINKVLYRDYA